jgi:hypothetical protein
VSVPPGHENRHDLGYLVVRSLLALWGLALCGMAWGMLVFHDAVHSETPRPREPIDFVFVAAMCAMGLLHLLPFGWLARRTGVRLVLQVATILLLGRLLIGLVQRGPTLEHVLTFAMFAVPPTLASCLIARQRRRVPDWRATT